MFKPEIQWIAPEKLTPYQNNPKKHSIKQLDKIAAQISAVGFTQPIVVDKDHVIIAGHGRREASLRLGLKSVPVIVASHLDEYQVKAARIADNRVAEEGEIDQDVLKFELGSLSLRDFDLKLTGFDLGQLDGMLSEPLADRPRNDSSGVTEGKGEKSSKTNPGANTIEQWIVAVECQDENTMRELFEDLTERGFKCKMIT